VTETWRRLCSEDIRGLKSSQTNVRDIKSGMLRWEAHVAHMGELKNVYKILINKREWRKHLENFKVGSWIFK
jgi:hypothetical protein